MEVVEVVEVVGSGECGGLLGTESLFGVYSLGLRA